MRRAADPAKPIREIAERWINCYEQHRVDELADLKKALEGTTMNKPEFVYTTATFAAEPRSKVTFDIEPLGDYVRLTVVHDGFGPGSAVLSGISEGWPLLISSLKSLLETGEVLPVSG